MPSPEQAWDTWTHGHQSHVTLVGLAKTRGDHPSTGEQSTVQNTGKGGQRVLAMRGTDRCANVPARMPVS